MNTEKKNWKLVNFCEFDPYAVKSYCAIHNVDESLNLGDITKVDERNIEPFTMIVGGRHVKISLLQVNKKAQYGHVRIVATNIIHSLFILVKETNVLIVAASILINLVHLCLLSG